MKAGRLVLGIAVLVLAGTAGVSSAAEAGPGSADEAAVRRLLPSVNQAWAEGDATRYAAFHTPDADLIDFRGVHAVGRRQIIGLLQPLFDGPLKGTRVEARIVDLRFLSRRVAIFHTEGRVVPTGANSVQTFVATKTAGRWLIAAFQNTRVQGTGG
ncbi:SgcJ/EcaC family oxidoreductase [Spirillospora sp. CA-294931]|uniref:SgcJ/EcaC family oxidoreductase n=1 Tax=Spirillospora sp. CA-294931 TaxID=3240042 RepID=UPI003D91AE55